MRIAIIGSGNVGSALAGRFSDLHDVVFASRDPSLPSPVEGVGRVPHHEASDAEVAILAVPAAAVVDVLAACGPLDGVVLVDATNAVGAPPPGGAESMAAVVAGCAPRARIVKAFNTAGAEVLADPDFGGQRAALTICGDDAGAVETVEGLVRHLGAEPLVLGGLDEAPLAEAFAKVWITLAFRRGLGRRWAVGILRR